MERRGQSRTTILISAVTVIVLVGLDRISKIFFSNTLSLGESIPIVRNIFYITLVRNTGIAFGLFRNQWVVSVIIPVILLALIAYSIYYYKKSKDVSRIYVIAVSLILSGAIGNLIDRMMFGYVIDFIDFRIWPVFNLADSAITIGTLLILFKCIPSFVK